MDILSGSILRDHSDIDTLTLNLHSLELLFTVSFQNKGWKSRKLENGDLKLEKGGTKIPMGIDFVSSVLSDKESYEVIEKLRKLLLQSIQAVAEREQ